MHYYMQFVKGHMMRAKMVRTTLSWVWHHP